MTLSRRTDLCLILANGYGTTVLLSIIMIIHGRHRSASGFFPPVSRSNAVSGVEMLKKIIGDKKKNYYTILRITRQKKYKSSRIVSEQTAGMRTLHINTRMCISTYRLQLCWRRDPAGAMSSKEGETKRTSHYPFTSRV